LQLHPHATLIGIDSSDDMLAIARQQLPSATFIASRLEDPLPEGPFDVVVSAFAIHHLDAEAKAVLFRRISQVLKERGRFAMLDVVPTEPDDRPLSLEEGIDKPSSVVEMLRWMSQAGLEGETVYAAGDLAILRATKAG
jgi:tRNA (cmo5U34)-methyltransferase